MKSQPRQETTYHHQQGRKVQENSYEHGGLRCRRLNVDLIIAYEVETKAEGMEENEGGMAHEVGVDRCKS